MELPNYRIWTLVSAACTIIFALAALGAVLVDPESWFAVSFLALTLAGLFGTVEFSRRALDRMSLTTERATSIVERAAEGIVTTDEQGMIETINPKAEEIFGYRQSELRDCNITVLLSSAYPEQEDGDLWDFLRLNALEATGRAHEVIGLRHDGSKFFMDLSFSDAVVGGRTIFVAIARDVTERKKAQIALRKASDELEVRVEQRTADLAEANRRLEHEISVHQRTHEEREKLVTELQGALAEIKTLSGLIPICASCKKVRDDQGYWNQIEVYVRDRSDAEFSHSICPDCVKELYPEISSE